jgi:hypothetical protein
MLDFLLGILAVFSLFGLLVVCWMLFCMELPKKPYSIELYLMACSQLRAWGWTEEEIKKIMVENGGYYDKD